MAAYNHLRAVRCVFLQGAREARQVLVHWQANSFWRNDRWLPPTVLLQHRMDTFLCVGSLGAGVLMFTS